MFKQYKMQIHIYNVAGNVVVSMTDKKNKTLFIIINFLINHYVTKISHRQYHGTNAIQKIVMNKIFLNHRYIH